MTVAVWTLLNVLFWQSRSTGWHPPWNGPSANTRAGLCDGAVAAVPGRGWPACRRLGTPERGQVTCCCSAAVRHGHRDVAGGGGKPAGGGGDIRRNRSPSSCSVPPPRRDGRRRRLRLGLAKDSADPGGGVRPGTAVYSRSGHRVLIGLAWGGTIRPGTWNSSTPPHRNQSFDP